ncbi:hypothetical protein H1R20_g12443, partial [Candolleomyces eurysporus]
MIIPITLPDPSTSSTSNPKLPPTLAKISHDEIVLIELQGALDVGDAHPSERNGKFVGKLSIDDGLKKPTLLIGHHLLEGKIAPIPKPLAIMHRTKSTNPLSSPSLSKKKKKKKHKSANSDLGAMDVDGDEKEEEEEEEEGTEEDMMEGQENTSASETEGQTSQWTIVGLVKKKIIFSKRPMPIIKR